GGLRRQRRRDPAHRGRQLRRQARPLPLPPAQAPRMIRLALRARPPRRLSLDGIVPERLAALGAGEIERLPLRDGNCPCVVADWFAVQAEGGGEARLVIAGESTA